MNLFSRYMNNSAQSSILEMEEDKKTKLLYSRFDYYRHKDHKHYFSKREVYKKEIDPTCKVCGLPLSVLAQEFKYKKLNPGSSKDLD